MRTKVRGARTGSRTPGRAVVRTAALLLATLAGLTGLTSLTDPAGAATLVLQQLGGSGNDGNDASASYRLGFTLGMPVVGDSAGPLYAVSYGFWVLPGGEIVPVPVTEGDLPIASAVFQNYPNPLRGSTTLEYRIAADKSGGAVPVRLEVYDVAGRRLATLVDEAHGPGQYRVQWDGRDQLGREVASGVYFARFSTANASKTIRMLRVR